MLITLLKSRFFPRSSRRNSIVPRELPDGKLQERAKKLFYHFSENKNSRKANKKRNINAF